ncbi:hypothetical protein BDV10DRAFT_99646 [Aspergillus recurvatus]
MSSAEKTKLGVFYQCSQCLSSLYCWIRERLARRLRVEDMASSPNPMLYYGIERSQ